MLGCAHIQNDWLPGGALKVPLNPWLGPAPYTARGAAVFGWLAVNGIHREPILTARPTGTVPASGRTTHPEKAIPSGDPVAVWIALTRGAVLTGGPAPPPRAARWLYRVVPDGAFGVNESPL